MRTKEQMYKDIRNWEMDAGESFLDYFGSNLNESNLLFWAMGRGYIDEEGFKAWEKDKYSSGDSIIYGEEPYSIVKESDEDKDEDGYEKAMKILAEFLASSDTYQKRVGHFLSDIHPIKLEDAIRYYWQNERILMEVDGNTLIIDRKLGDTHFVDFSLLGKAKWYRDDRDDMEDDE